MSLKITFKKNLKFLVILTILLFVGGNIFAETLYEYYNTGDDGETLVYDIYWYSQSFTPQVNHGIELIKIKVKRAGSPGTTTVSIRETDGSGKPTGADLTSGSFDGNTLATTTTEWKEISVSSYSLRTDTKYAVVVRAINGDGSNYVKWGRDATSPTYARGNYLESADSGVNWSNNVARDFMFEEWGEKSSYITVPTEFATSALAYAGDLFTDLNLAIVLTIGLPMAFYVIKKIIALV